MLSQIITNTVERNGLNLCLTSFETQPYTIINTRKLDLIHSETVNYNELAVVKYILEQASFVTDHLRLSNLCRAGKYLVLMSTGPKDRKLLFILLFIPKNVSFLLGSLNSITFFMRHGWKLLKELQCFRRIVSLGFISKVRPLQWSQLGRINC